MLPPEAIVHETDEQIVARAGPVLVWVSTGQLEDAPLQLLREALDQLARDQPQGVGLCMIAVGESELPRLQTRRRVIRGLAELGERLQAVAATFEGDRRWLQLARSTFEGIFSQVEGALIGKRFPMRVFGERDEAVLWLSEIVCGADRRPISDTALAEVVDELHARLTESKTGP